MKKQIVLSDYMKIADIHATRLKGTLAQTATWTPLTADNLAQLSLDKIAFLDMMTMRFGKLQDVIGAKIFALIIQILGEDAATLIDRLNLLEKLGYINDANWWMDLREIRNQVMHDYPDDYDAICTHLSILIKKSYELLDFWDELKNKIAALPLNYQHNKNS